MPANVSDATFLFCGVDFALCLFDFLLCPCIFNASKFCEWTFAACMQTINHLLTLLVLCAV